MIKMKPEKIKSILNNSVKLRNFCIEKNIGILEGRKTLETQLKKPKSQKKQTQSPEDRLIEFMKKHNHKLIQRVEEIPYTRKDSKIVNTSLLTFSNGITYQVSNQKFWKKSNKTEDSAYENPIKGIVIGQLKNYQNRRNFVLDDLVDSVNEEMEQNNIHSTLVTPLKGEVSNILYTIAEERKYVGVESKNITKKRTDRPITKTNLADILNLEISNQDTEHIIGIISEDYIKNNYNIKDAQIVLIGGNEKANIEGRKKWDGTKKNRIRDMLADYAEQYIFKPREEKIKDLNNQRKKNSEEFNEATEEIKNLDKEDKTVEFHGDTREIRKLYKKFKEKYGNNEIKLEKNWKKLKIKGLNEIKIISALSNHWEKIKEEFPKTTSNLYKIKSQIETRHKLTGLRHEILNKNDGVHSELNSITLPKYLGLEGPNMSSFLKLDEKNKLQRLEGLFVERNHKDYNLMKSMIKSNIGHQMEKRCHVINDNIDDQILLDFVKDKEVKLKGNSRNLEVTYKGESISLDNYHSLLKDLDKNGDYKSFKILGETYNISYNFLDAVSRRLEGKFDVVFMDYVGPINSRKKRVLEKLVESRLSDNAVIASSFNSCIRVNNRATSGIKANEADKYIKNTWSKIFQSNGYKVNNTNSRRYKDNKDNMCFHIYNINKTSLPTSKKQPEPQENKIKDIIQENYNKLTKEQINNNEYGKIYEDSRLNDVGKATITAYISHCTMDRAKKNN